MKSKNWKLCILVIFLAVCFSIYAGDCYSQTYGTGTLSDILNRGQWNTGYPVFSVQNYYPIQSNYPIEPYPSIYQGYTLGYGSSWTRTPIWGWREPPGKSTLKLLQDLMSGHSLTYADVYGIEDEPVYGIVSYNKTRTYPYTYGLGFLGSTINTSWSDPYGYYGGYNYSYGYGL